MLRKDGIRILYLFKVGKGKTGLGTQCLTQGNHDLTQQMAKYQVRV